MSIDKKDYCKDYLIELPLPLAQLYDRLYNHSSNINDQHDNGFYLFEALIKLTTITLVAQYRIEIEQTGQREPALDTTIRNLQKPSLGHWIKILRELMKYFANRTQADGKPHGLAHLKKQLERKHYHQDSPALLALYCRIKNGVDTPSTNDSSCNLMALFDALTTYRNNVMGHGASRQPEFYANMTPLLMAAGSTILTEDMLTPLGMRGATLIYLQDIKKISSTQVEINYRKLIGIGGESTTTPIRLDKALADTLMPKVVAIQFPHQLLPVRLDPLTLYDDSVHPAQVWLLNSNHKDKNIEYLNYFTGKTIRTDEMVKATSEMLATLVGDAVIQPLIPDMGSVNAKSSRSRLEDFELLAEIGRGGMGQVYLARQLSLGRLVALKMLPNNKVSNAVAMARFEQEIKILSQCDHPNIVKVYTDGDLPEGGLFYAMEYLQGADLAKVWSELAQSAGTAATTQVSERAFIQALQQATTKAYQRIQTTSPANTSQSGETAGANFVLPKLPQAPLPELPDAKQNRQHYIRHVVRLIRDVARALQTLHEQKIIHRDIKPSNLLLSADGKRLVLTDFGLVKHLDQSRDLSSMASKGLIGTLRYAAPEQLAAATMKITPAVDVRGLGVVLWEMLTLKEAFGELKDEQQASQAVLSNDLQPLRVIDPTFDKDLDAIVTRATERRCAERIQTAAQLADYLDLYLDEKPLPIRPWTFTEKMIRGGRRHPGRVALAASVALALSGAGAYGLYWNYQQEQYVLPHHTYYSDITFRNGMFVGINPLSAEAIEKRHESLRFTTQGRKGNITEIATVTKNGECSLISSYKPIFDIMTINNFSQNNSWGLSKQDASICRIEFDNELKELTARGKNNKFIYSLDYGRLAMSNNKVTGSGCFRNEGESIPQNRSSAGASCLTIMYDEEGKFAGFPKIVKYDAVDADGISRKQITFDDAGRVQKIIGILLKDNDATSEDGDTNTKSNPIIELTYDKRGNLIRSHNKGYLIQPVPEVQFEYDDHGNLLKTSFHDRNGKAINDKNGVHQIKIKYDNAGNILELEQTDVLGRLVTDKQAGVAKAVVAYNQQGKPTKVESYDSAGKLATGQKGFSKQELIYDDDGILTEERLYGVKGIRENEDDYVVVNYNRNGSLIQRAFYDSNNNLILGGDGYAKAQAVYDEKSNKEIANKYYGVDGRLSNEPYGYAIKKINYDKDFNLVLSEEYYGANEEPVVNKDGYQTVKYEYDKKNRRIKEEYLDALGQPTLNTDGFHIGEIIREDDLNSRHEETRFYGTNGNLVNRVKEGFAILKIHYNANNEVIRTEIRDKDNNLTTAHQGFAIQEIEFNDLNSALRDRSAYYGADGNLMVWDEVGFAETKTTYNDMGKPTITEYLDENHHPMINPLAGYAKVFNAWDARGNKTLTQYFDDKRQLTTPPYYNYAEYRAKYDENDNLIEYSLFDEKGNLIPDENGCGISKIIFNENRRIEYQCFGVDGKLGSVQEYPAIIRYEYDGLGNQTKESYYDADNQRIINNRSGCARLEWSYDEKSNKETEMCFGTQNEPKTSNIGVVKFRYIYDASGNKTEEHYLDQNNQPINTPDGDAKVTIEYDDYNRPIKWQHFDSHGKRALTKMGYSIHTKTYDDHGDIISSAYFGVDEKPIIVKELGFAKADLQSCQFFDENDQTFPPNFAVTVKNPIEGKTAWFLGVKAGDVLTHYNGTPVTSTCQFIQLVDELEKSKETTLTELSVLRNGEPKVFTNVKTGKIGVEIINELRQPAAEAPQVKP